MDCFWPRCSNRGRCAAFGSCVAKAQAGGASFPKDNMQMTQPMIKAGWRNEGIEEAVELISSIPELNAVLERESAILAQNVVSAMASALHENQVAKLANNETKKALARSMLIGLQEGMKIGQKKVNQ